MLKAVRMIVQTASSLSSCTVGSRGTEDSNVAYMQTRQTQSVRNANQLFFLSKLIIIWWPNSVSIFLLSHTDHRRCVGAGEQIDTTRFLLCRNDLSNLLASSAKVIEVE